MAAAQGRILLVHRDRSVLQQAEDMLLGVGSVALASAEAAAQQMKEDTRGGVLVAEQSQLGAPPLAEVLNTAWPVVALAAGDEAEGCWDALREGRLAGFARLPLQAPELRQAVHLALTRHGARGATPARDRASPADLERFRNDALMIAAHDIRSPLSVIVGYAGVLLDPEQGLSARGRQIAERMRATSNRLLTLVDRILDLAAIESSQQALHYQETRLSELIQEAVDTLGGMIEGKQVALSVDVSGDDATYLLDQPRALQVLQNVLSNAVKFNAEGGAVTITCRGAPDEVAFSVRDSGVGLSTEQQARVFEKFARVSPDREQGSGLGLAIAKTVVELHGGRIWVESEPGAGATFHFTLVPGKP